ncbi:MAG: hypothetical protein VX301_12820, partial [Pseudomonadota bacterium]|nr:hypothetical protein [Pseudomonadota bacterium]
CDAPQASIEQWLTERQQAGTDVSDAGIEVMHHQLQEMEPLDADEAALSIRVDTASDSAMSDLSEQLRKRL